MEATIERKCFVCQEVKPITEYYLNGKTKCGTQKISHRCKKCCDKRKRTATKNRLASMMYGHQKVNSKRRGHPKPEYSVKELREWLLSQEKYHKLHQEWVKSGFDKMKIPSCDRLDDYKPYTFDNIRLVTWQENLKKAAEDIISGTNRKTCKPIKQYSKTGEFIKEHYSIASAARSIDGNRKHITKCKNGTRKSASGFIWKE